MIYSFEIKESKVTNVISFSLLFSFSLAVSESQQVAEAGLLITEFLHSINQSVVLVDHLRSSWTAWLLDRTASSPVLMGVLRVIGMAVASSSTLGHLMEAALEAYFKYNGKQPIDYFHIKIRVFHLMLQI